MIGYDFCSWQTLLKVSLSRRQAAGALRRWLIRRYCSEANREQSLQQKQHMSRNHKGWKIDRLGGRFSFVDAAVPEVRPGRVLIRVESQPLMSYLKPTSQANSRPIAHRRTSFRVETRSVSRRQSSSNSAMIPRTALAAWSAVSRTPMRKKSSHAVR